MSTRLTAAPSQHNYEIVSDLTNCFLLITHNQLLCAGAGPMQAPGLFDIPDKRGKLGLVHNIGLGGAVVVSILRRPEFYREGGKDGRDRCDLIFAV